MLGWTILNSYTPLKDSREARNEHAQVITNTLVKLAPRSHEDKWLWVGDHNATEDGSTSLAIAERWMGNRISLKDENIYSGGSTVRKATRWDSERPWTTLCPSGK